MTTFPCLARFAARRCARGGGWSGSWGACRGGRSWTSRAPPASGLPARTRPGPHPTSASAQEIARSGPARPGPAHSNTRLDPARSGQNGAGRPCCPCACPPAPPLGHALPQRMIPQTLGGRAAGPGRPARQGVCGPNVPSPPAAIRPCRRRTERAPAAHAGRQFVWGRRGGGGVREEGDARRGPRPLGRRRQPGPARPGLARQTRTTHPPLPRRQNPRAVAVRGLSRAGRSPVPAPRRSAPGADR